MKASDVQDSCYAWIVCIATFLVLVIQYGIIYSMGVFYIMFQQGLDAGDSALSLVTSLNYSFMYLICPFVGILTGRYGERPLAITGAFLGTIGLACSSFTSEPYHLYLSYSLIAGIGGGMVYNPCISILEKYFKKYLRIATGLAVCGSGVGAFIFPPIIKALEDKYGWRGALLLIAGIYAHIIILSCLYQPVTLTQECTYRETAIDSEVISNCTNGYVHSRKHLMREDKQGKDDAGVKFMRFDESVTKSYKTLQYYPTNVTKDDSSGHSLKIKEGKLLDLQSNNIVRQIISLFKSVPYTCLCLYSLFTLFPIVLVYTHLGSYILTLGFTKSNVVTLYTVIGITTTITRVLFGTLGEFARAWAIGGGEGFLDLKGKAVL